MAKNTTSETATTTRKKRTPRALSDLEREAKQQLDDAKALGKILPVINKLGPWGMTKLQAHMAQPATNETHAGNFGTEEPEVQ